MRSAVLRCISLCVLAGCGPRQAEAKRPSEPTGLAPHVAPSTSSSRSDGAKPSPAITPSEPVWTNAEWGTAHPVVLAAAAPHGNWIALCQAREDTNADGRISIEVGEQGELKGDRITGYLAVRPGSGDLIESFAGNDPSGRYVAFVAKNHLMIRDTWSRSDVDLSARGADSSDDLSNFRHHRAIAFAPDGKRVAYIRDGEPRPTVVVRELSTGIEASIDPGEGELWRADFDMTGQWVVLRVVSTDTNKNGRLDWSVRKATRQSMRCPPPLAKYPAWDNSGDRAMPRLAPATGGTAVDAPNLILPLGQLRVERSVDGALVLRRTNGSYVTLSAAKCEARLVHADPARSLVIATCRQKNGRHAMFLLGDGYEKALGREMASPGSDHWFDGSPRLVPIYGGADTALVDMETRDIVALQPADRVVATHGMRALILRGDRLVLVTRGAAESTFDQRVADFPRILRSAQMVFVSPWVVDLEKGAVLGRADADPLALALDGKILVAAAESDVTRLSLGPLRWLSPEN